MKLLFIFSEVLPKKYLLTKQGQKITGRTKMAWNQEDLYRLDDHFTAVFDIMFDNMIDRIFQNMSNKVYREDFIYRIDGTSF
jgi:hypothetical protein